MKKFIIKTLGCKVNQYESESLCLSLKNAGFEESKGEPADLCIINTCTVTGKASMQSRQAIRQAIRSNPEARIVVTGCYAQTEPDAIEKIPGVHDIVPNPAKHTIPERTRRSRHADAPDGPRYAIRAQQTFSSSPDLVFGKRTRPFLKIQDGCDAFCSYCIVPYARGPRRSMDVESVLDHIRRLGESGAKEIVLTGIHLGNYGLDLIPPKNLLTLLERIHELNAVERVRLSSIEPNEIREDIVRLVQTSAVICDHFHIPLQSGNDDILKKMNRPYSRSFFRERINYIHQCMPTAAIGVDTLIGFPGETEKAFEDTYSLIRELPVSYLHVFPFSPRKGTMAAEMPEKVSSFEIKDRCSRIRDLGKQKKSDFHNRFNGKTVDVLVEGSRDKNTGRLKGLTSNYVKVLVEGPATLENTIVPVKLEAHADHTAMMGKVIPYNFCNSEQKLPNTELRISSSEETRRTP